MFSHAYLLQVEQEESTALSAVRLLRRSLEGEEHDEEDELTLELMELEEKWARRYAHLKVRNQNKPVCTCIAPRRHSSADVTPSHNIEQQSSAEVSASQQCESQANATSAPPLPHAAPAQQSSCHASAQVVSLTSQGHGESRNPSADRSTQDEQLTRLRESFNEVAQLAVGMLRQALQGSLATPPSQQEAQEVSQHINTLCGSTLDAVHGTSPSSPDDAPAADPPVSAAASASEIPCCTANDAVGQYDAHPRRNLGAINHAVLMDALLHAVPDAVPTDQDAVSGAVLVPSAPDATPDELASVRSAPVADRPAAVPSYASGGAPTGGRTAQSDEIPGRPPIGAAGLVAALDAAWAASLSSPPGAAGDDLSCCAASCAMPGTPILPPPPWSGGCDTRAVCSPLISCSEDGNPVVCSTPESGGVLPSPPLRAALMMHPGRRKPVDSGQPAASLAVLPRSWCLRPPEAPRSLLAVPWSGPPPDPGAGGRDGSYPAGDPVGPRDLAGILRWLFYVQSLMNIR